MGQGVVDMRTEILNIVQAVIQSESQTKVSEHKMQNKHRARAGRDAR